MARFFCDLEGDLTWKIIVKQNSTHEKEHRRAVKMFFDKSILFLLKGLCEHPGAFKRGFVEIGKGEPMKLILKILFGNRLSARPGMIGFRVMSLIIAKC